MNLLAALILSLALLTAPVRAEVLVVDAAGGPGAQFTALQDAVDAAADGDMLLVRSGTYSGFTIDGKGLSIVEDAGATVDVGPELYSVCTVQHLAADQCVLLRGLDFESFWSISGGGVAVGTTVSLRDNAGAVWLEDCGVHSGRPSLLVHECADVTLVGCLVEGYPDSALACRVEGAVVTCVGSTLSGSDGHDAQPNPPNSKLAAPGGIGLAVQPFVSHAAVTLMACTLKGGAGGDGYPFLFCPPPADGGDAVHTSGGENAFVCLVDCTLLGGAAGFPVACAPPAADGQAFGGDGLLLALPGAPPHLQGVPPVREDEAVTLVLTGTPGDSAFLLVSAVPGGALLAGKGGDLLLGGAALLLPLGMLPPAGTLTLAGRAPLVGPALQDAVAYLQGASCSPGGTCLLGTGTTLVVLAKGV